MNKKKRHFTPEFKAKVAIAHSKMTRRWWSLLVPLACM